MQPIRNNVLFRPFLADEKTQGGIVVPDAYRGYSDKGEVVAVGEKSKLKAGVVGYRVHEWKVAEVEIGGVLHLLMEDKAIIAIE